MEHKRRYCEELFFRPHWLSIEGWVNDDIRIIFECTILFFWSSEDRWTFYVVVKCSNKLFSQCEAPLAVYSLLTIVNSWKPLSKGIISGQVHLDLDYPWHMFDHSVTAAESRLIRGKGEKRGHQGQDAPNITSKQSSGLTNECWADTWFPVF